MNQEYRPPKRSWTQKFWHALLGIRWGIRDQNSFRIHAICAALVIAAGGILRVERWEWCILLIAITVVLAAEMFNSALEHLAPAIDRRENSRIGTALDISSGAVLLVAIGASLVGCLVLGWRVWQLLI